MRQKDRRSVETQLRHSLADFHRLLGGDVPSARKVLDELLADRLVFMPITDVAGEKRYGSRLSSRLAEFARQPSVHTVWRPRADLNRRPLA
jgi:hypothetical protein